jgi:hypothetical protein
VKLFAAELTELTRQKAEVALGESQPRQRLPRGRSAFLFRNRISAGKRSGSVSTRGFRTPDPMKTSTAILSLALCFLATSLAAQAQLMRLSLSGTVRAGTPGENWFAPGEPVFGETRVRLDVTYNASLIPSPWNIPGEPVVFYHPENDPQAGPADYTFRLRFGNVDVTRPISHLAVNDNGSFSSEAFGEGYEFDFQLWIDPTPGNPLPTTLPDWIDEVDVVGTGGYVLAENFPHSPPFDYGIILVDFKDVTLTPVPEPSTYGLAAAAFLGSLMVFGRRRWRRYEAVGP